MAPTSKRESAGEISKRYGLADLVRTRMLARRLYLNSLAKRASISFQDSLDVGLLDPDLTPLEVSLLQSKKYLFLNDPVTSRRSIPAFETRYACNRRLAEIEAERLEAEDRAERMLARYMTRSQAKKISGPEGDKDKRDSETNDNNNEDNIDQNEKNEEDDEILDDDLYLDGLDPGYLDYMSYPYDMSTWRHPGRLYRRRLHPYRFRPLGVTTRLLERRLREL